MVRRNHAILGDVRLREGDGENSPVAKAHGEGGARGIGEKGREVGHVSGQAKGLEVGLYVEGGGKRRRGSSEVGMEGEVAEVASDGVVAGGGEEYVAVVEGVSVIFSGGGGRIRVVVEDSIEGEDEER